ncbi:calpain-7-like isoform X1 [Ctenocephalides felis]|uniref:calpain-7-like isoform X1 n=1 Tax=Ctenocephalides felis TaxID=7515 RepID=UPI000E6E1716|nr:calpain-7-like isoform X1 [Ctenocephalides felis]
MSILAECHSLIKQGLEADEAGNKDDAIKFYVQAGELYITISDAAVKEQLKGIIQNCISRAEELKGIQHKAQNNTQSSSNSSSPSTPVGNAASPTSPIRPPLHRGSSAHLKVSGGQETYGEDEKKVLKHTSHINQKIYLPFIAEDINETFNFPMPFSDRDGILELSPKQKRDFVRWSTLSELHPEPRIVSGHQVNYMDIKQTVVSDCSFVASLAVAALYEQRFQKRLITSILYPRNKNDEPRYNPDGKYMVKLHVNGIPRKVIIDDRLPVGYGNRLLCSYSSNTEEFWVSLLEKAYMKVMGGYDFPGSNSNIDLHALTGWIPERVAIRPEEQDFNGELLFAKIMSGLARGKVLVTVATGELSEADQDRTGLVATHAYAVMDAVNVDGVNLLKLKNPWSHLRWRGNYSELDTIHWTQELQEQLNYDPNLAARHDNGIFWIDYTSLCNFFDVFYMNWNPEIFQYTYCIHQTWNAGVGPAKDAYTVGENPQFSLNVSQGVGEIWVLLTRHITSIEDFRDNQEYITILVYKNEGKRVYYPSSPPPYIDGVRINSPHYLCKIRMDPERARKYTLVISQYEKSTTIYYTLRAYSKSPFQLSKIQPFPYTIQETGEWNCRTAGGCANYPATYLNNPKYRLELKNRLDHHMLIELRGPREYQIGLEVTIISLENDSVNAPFKSRSTGAYRSGFVALDLEELPSGVYEILPSTFYPNQESPFFLTVKCSSPVKFIR